MRSKPRKLDGDGLWNLALRLLGQRAHSAFELRRKLSLRAESPEILTVTLAKLREYGFEDDKKYSETLASSRLQNEGFGRQRVLRELQSKRVASTVAGEAVEKAFAGTDENQLIEQFLRRKYRGKNLRELLQQQKNQASAYRKLRMAGFSSQASIQAMKRHSAAVEEWEPTDEDELSESD